MAKQQIAKRLLSQMDAPQVAELLGLELEAVEHIGGADSGKHPTED